MPMIERSSIVKGLMIPAAAMARPPTPASFTSSPRAGERTRQSPAERIAGFLPGDEIDRERSPRRRIVHRAGTSSNTREENLRAIGGGNDRARFGDDRAARGDGQSGKPRARDVLDCSRADRWQIEATVLAGLRRLHQNAYAGRRHHAPLPPQVGDAGEQIVGAFRRFERST